MWSYYNKYLPDIKVHIMGRFAQVRSLKNLGRLLCVRWSKCYISYGLTICSLWCFHHILNSSSLSPLFVIYCFHKTARRLVKSSMFFSRYRQLVHPYLIVELSWIVIWAFFNTLRVLVMAVLFVNLKIACWRIYSFPLMYKDQGYKDFWSCTQGEAWACQSRWCYHQEIT